MSVSYGENDLLSSFLCHRLVSTLCQHSGTPRQSHPTWHKATSFSPNPNWQLEGAEAPSTARAVEGRSWEAPTHRGGTSEETPGSSFKATRKP